MGIPNIPIPNYTSLIIERVFISSRGAVRKHGYTVGKTGIYDSEHDFLEHVQKLSVEKNIHVSLGRGENAMGLASSQLCCF